MCRTIVSLATGLLFLLGWVVVPDVAIAATTNNIGFDVNDISILWPVPTQRSEVNELISADDRTANGTSEIWPAFVFDSVIKTAQTVQLSDSTGTTHAISFGEPRLQTAFRQPHTWKVVGIRIDPSAPGSSSRLIRQFGSRPQVRLIMQPVTVDNFGNVEVHDYTAHLVYDFTQRGGGKPRPDKAKFTEIVSDLRDLKLKMASTGISTAGLKLGVHPGFNDGTFTFEDALTAFLKKHLSLDRLTGVAFMGLEPPEPWIFFAMTKVNGAFVRIPAPTLGRNQAQMLGFVGGDVVFPVSIPNGSDGKHGVNTAVLFEPDVQLSSRQDPSQPRPLLQDIPDIIANPQIAHFFNTDCVSCHSESARRQDLNISTKDARFQYQRPVSISGTNTALLPSNQWNVRNFGWFPDFFGTGATVATVTMRTANETAEAVEFINHEYLQHESIINVVAKNNGFDGAHLRRRPEQLSALGAGNFCVLETGESVGIGNIEPVKNGFAKVNVVIPNSSCPEL